MRKEKIVLIGASTGGPGHLKKILSNLGTDFTTPIIIAQHMNSIFIESFVKQFDTELPNKVHLAQSQHSLSSANVFICANHCGINKNRSELFLEKLHAVDSVYNPSVDALFLSAVRFCSSLDILAILLTGIGHDGALGLSELRKNGARCIAESEKSAVVYGMPKKAIEIDPQISVMDLDEICRVVKDFERN